MNSNKQLIEHLLDRGVLKTPTIINAFEIVNRFDFVPPEVTELVYADTALPIGLGQTISQPYTVAYMLELLRLQAGHSVLDIGSGSGWQTALLAQIVGERGHVTAVEIVPELCEKGRQNISKYSFIEKGIVEIHCQSGLLGYSNNAPYDRIIAAAAGTNIPVAWLEETRIGGRIVAPINNSLMLLVKKRKNEWTRENYRGFTFVPLIVD